MSCPLEEAVRSCPKDRHICTALELHTGGYLVARSIGWLEGGMHVWTHTAVQKRVAMAPQPATEYIRCASEGELCACSGEVAFGSDRNWSQWVSAPTGSVNCSSVAFGVDWNATGEDRHCACRQPTKDPGATPSLGLALCCEGETA